MNILSKLKVVKFASAFFLASILFITTACNSGNQLGARPDVSPVQLGGQNNPHKAGGDGMGRYRSPANDSILGKDSATLPSNSLLAAANQSLTPYPTDDDQVEGLLYSDSSNPESLKSVDDFVSYETQQALKDPSQIPAVKQPIIDRSNPDNRLLEKTQQMFDDAGNFSAN